MPQPWMIYGANGYTGMLAARLAKTRNLNPVLAGRSAALIEPLARELGFDVDEASVGGGSDGNFCAAVNPAVMDGLGAVGDGAHAITEHVERDQLAPRAALTARLLETI